MALSVGSRPSRLRPALAAILTILILVPAGLLFLRVWQDIEDQRDRTERQRQGVEYLTALSPLVSALAEAQSSALQTEPAAPASLAAAVSRAAAADQRLGEDLGTRERWTGLREKISALPGAGNNPLQVFQAHVEVSDLTLALYRTVLTNSELSRDQDNDVSHLQAALGVDLPTTVVQVSRMGDLSLLTANISGSAQQRQQAQAILVPQFGAAVQSVNAAVNSLTDNLQAAVDDTESTTLSGSLVTTVDSFRRGVESFIRGASPGGTAPPNPAAMATAQSQLQTSLSSLAGVMVREMTGLLDDRLDGLDNRRIETLALAGLILLLALAAVLVPLLGRRHRAGLPPSGAEAGRDMSVSPGGGPPGAYAHSHLDPVPPYGGDQVYPTRRERSGALR
ncbi:MAG TPA: hypothetical protein VFH03_16685 [Actinoplanes sp.]|nr:hypothetical protein [Actinoplanes sp.]